MPNDTKADMPKICPTLCYLFLEPFDGVGR